MQKLSERFKILKTNFQAGLVEKMDMQSLEWLYWIPLRVTVPAGEGFDQQVDIKSDAHFDCKYITGDFQTKAGGADDGVNHVTVRISDASNDLKLMNSAVPLDLMCSPGRVRTPGLAGDPSNGLFYPFPFEHIFAANGGILAEFQNDSDDDIIVNLLFVGTKKRVR